MGKLPRTFYLATDFLARTAKRPVIQGCAETHPSPHTDPVCGGTGLCYHDWRNSSQESAFAYTSEQASRCTNRCEVRQLGPRADQARLGLQQDLARPRSGNLERLRHHLVRAAPPAAFPSTPFASLLPRPALEHRRAPLSQWDRRPLVRDGGAQFLGTNNKGLHVEPRPHRRQLPPADRTEGYLLRIRPIC